MELSFSSNEINLTKRNPAGHARKMSKMIKERVVAIRLRKKRKNDHLIIDAFAITMVRSILVLINDPPIH